MENVAIDKKRYHWLDYMVKKHQFKFGAEVGTGRGLTARYLLIHNPKLRLVEVAWFPNEHINKSYTRKDNCPPGFRCGTGPVKRAFYQRMKKFVLDGRAIIIAKPSHEAYIEIADDSLDFVFIDADHSYEHTLEDIRDWIPKVKIGGLIVGHDFGHPRHVGVEPAVREYFGDNFELSVNKIWYTWKR